MWFTTYLSIYCFQLLTAYMYLYGPSIYMIRLDIFLVTICPSAFLNNTLLYCIVLYLYIYIVLLAVYANQQRFQCEVPREKRAVLRERKEALGSPVNKVNLVEGRNWF